MDNDGRRRGALLGAGMIRPRRTISCIVAGFCITVLVAVGGQWLGYPTSAAAPIMPQGATTRVALPDDGSALLMGGFFVDGVVCGFTEITVAGRGPFGPDRVDHAFIRFVVSDVARRREALRLAPSVPAGHESDRVWLNLIFYTAGWPFRCVEGSTALQVYGEDSGGEWSHGLIRPERGTRIVYRPAWFGLIANTTIYAAAVLGVLALVGTRADRRRRRGCCEACGYDRRGLAAGAPCPECGRELAARPSPGKSA